MSLIKFSQANLPNLRRLFVEARTDAEESAYSRTAVSSPILELLLDITLYLIVLQHRSLHVFRCGLQSRGSTSEQSQLLKLTIQYCWFWLLKTSEWKTKVTGSIRCAVRDSKESVRFGQAIEGLNGVSGR